MPTLTTDGGADLNGTVNGYTMVFPAGTAATVDSLTLIDGAGIDNYGTLTLEEPYPDGLRSDATTFIGYPGSTTFVNNYGTVMATGSASGVT